MMEKGKVLIAAPVHDVLYAGLEAAGYIPVMIPVPEQKGVLPLLEDCSGIVLSTKLRVNRSFIDAASGLRWIGRMGSGMELIDVDYAREKGIVCFSSPEGNANAVAEHALGMLLSLTKRVHISSREVMAGAWRRESNRGMELEGKTIGIIGYGHTGQAFVRKLSGFDMRILVYDKYQSVSEAHKVVICNDLYPIWEQADIISFHVPLQHDTVHYLNEAFLSQMQRSFILINTSRGAIAATRTVFAGLQSGKIAGACLDVLEEEPLPAMTEEMQHMVAAMAAMDDRVIITPHIAGYSREALYKMSKSLLEQVTGL